MVWQNLERNISQELGVMSSKDDAHSTFTNLRRDFICANAHAGVMAITAEIISFESFSGGRPYSSVMDAVISWLGNTMQQESARLVQGLHKGDPEVVDRLIETFQHRLLRYLLSLTGNRSKAEDLFQETW